MSSKLGLVTRIIRQNTKNFTTSRARCVSQEQIEKIKKKQAFVQAENEHKPIHLVGGKFHFYATTVLGVVTLAFVIRSMHRLISNF